MHPRPSPIAASLYTLRDMNVDVIIMHGPHGCCFRTGRLLESDGVRVLTTAMAENDFILGASEKLENTLKEAYDMFKPEFIGVVGTCASMIIGEDLKEAIANANLDCTVIPVESHGGFGEGDNTEGAIMVLDSAVEYGIIPREEADRQIEMLKKATEIEKTRGMAQGKYIQPNFGDNKEEVAKKIIKALRDNKKVAFVLNAKKETSYLFADILNFDYREINPENKPIIVANLDENIGLSRIRNHAVNIKQELKTDIDYITGGLDEYPVTGKAAADYLKENPVDLYVVCGVPHAFPVEEIEGESIAVTDGPRLVEPLRDLGYDNVVAELDAHSKTLGTDKIVFSDFGGMIRSAIDYKSGNLKSISNGFKKIGCDVEITSSIEKIADSDYLVLPGVGAFGSAMENLEEFKKVIHEHVDDDKPFLGVCLGQQVLMDSSEESPDVDGLKLFEGHACYLPEGLKIPHMGWNKLDVVKKCPILEGVDKEYFYFVHSYHVVPDNDEIIAGTCDYGIDVVAALSRNNLFSTQFHPEKSGVAGLKILKNFVNLEL